MFARCVIDCLYIIEIPYLCRVLSSANRIYWTMIAFLSACVSDLLPSSVDIRLCGADSVTCTYLKYPACLVSYHPQSILIQSASVFDLVRSTVDFRLCSALSIVCI